MLVGHNPGLEELLLLFTGNTEVMPTGAIAKLLLKTTRWTTAIEKRATLDWIVRPKDLEER